VIERAIVRTFLDWNEPVIQEQIELPKPYSREIVRLEKPQQQWVAWRDLLLRLLRHQKQIRSFEQLRKEKNLQDNLVDLSCEQGTTAQIIAKLLQLQDVREKNRTLFKGIAEYGSHETIQAIYTAGQRAAASPLMAAPASGFTKVKGGRSE
jgi:hypothetical protein